MGRIFAYTRRSTDDKGQDVAVQESAILSAGHSVLMFFTDDASGKTAPANRPGLSRLLHHVRTGDLIVVTALDRLSRRTVDAITMMEDLASRGVGVLSLREARLSTDTADGKFLITLHAALATRERDITSERVKQGLAYTRAKGTRLGRPHKPERAKAIELLAQGMAVPDVVAATGLNLRTIYRLKAAEKTS
ncbi:recombinase family protein [Salmonella enterica]|nr:recombinase family protein [Salmonella enterica]